MANHYKVAQNPKDKLWYVCGYCGNGYWMPVSSGFNSRNEAESHIAHQLKADRAARIELTEV